MDAGKNPFSPGAGTPPPELAGRSDVLRRSEVVLERIRNSRSERSLLFVGLRGVGKTVLLNEVKKRADNLGYLHIKFEAPEDRDLAEILVPLLRTALLKLSRIEGVKDKLQKALSALRNFAAAFSVRYPEYGVEVTIQPGTADSGYLEHDLIELLTSIGEAAKESSSPFAIFIDELQYVEERQLGALIAAVHQCNQLTLPVVMFGAGLPQLARLTGDAKSYSERLFEFHDIDALDLYEAKNAIEIPLNAEGVEIEELALNRIISLTEGYPYFLQEWGSHAWLIADDSPITVDDVDKATVRATEELDRGFFRVRFDRLTPGEKDYMRAMAERGKGPHRSGDIAQMLNRPVNELAPTRAKIISKGMIYSPHHGDTAFTVPKFDEYLLRAIPDFKPRVPKRRKV